MISHFDDYAVHQTSEPVNQPAQSDRNFYDRYWFNGFDRDAAYAFAVGFGLYPNRFIMDGHFTVVAGGVQTSFHGSRRAPRERSESRVGPLSIEVLRPLRVLRVHLEPNKTGIECDLTFEARTSATQEPRSQLYEGGRVMMDTTRFTQLGCWRGSFTVAGKRTDVDVTTTLGTRDRSWGVRPVGEPAPGAPPPYDREPGIYWAWAPIHFDDVCTMFGTFEDHDGSPLQVGGALVPRYLSLDAIPQGDDPGHREMASVIHRIQWAKGTRRPQGAEIELLAREGDRYAIKLTPMARIQMLGIGYTHPEWGHGMWKGDEAIASETWRLDDLDPLDIRHLHTQHICRAEMGSRKGVGTLETLVIGSHKPSGFDSFLDGAA